MKELNVPKEVPAERIHTCQEVLIYDGKPLLVGWGRHNIPPDDRELLIYDDPTDEVDVDPACLVAVLATAADVATMISGAA